MAEQAEQHEYAFHFTRVERGKSLDVYRCPCGVVGYRQTGTTRNIVRDKRRWASVQYASCAGKKKADARKARTVSELSLLCSLL